MAAGGDVAVADVARDHGARAFGDPGRLPELQRASGRSPLDPVVDGLAVRTDGVHPSVVVGQFLGHVAEEAAYGHVEAADLLDGGGRRRQYGRDGLADRGRVGHGAVLDEVAHEHVAVELEIGQDGLHGVEGRARDHADYAHQVNAPYVLSAFALAGRWRRAARRRGN
jgi:hypothetical protein